MSVAHKTHCALAHRSTSGVKAHAGREWLFHLQVTTIFHFTQDGRQRVKGCSKPTVKTKGRN